MHRTTIMLPDDLRHAAEKKAKLRGMSIGAFVRHALKKELDESGGQVKYDAFLADDRVFRGKAPCDVAERHDDYLYGN